MRSLDPRPPPAVSCLAWKQSSTLFSCRNSWFTHNALVFIWSGRLRSSTMTFIRRRNSSLRRTYNHDAMSYKHPSRVQVHTLSKSRIFQMVTMSLCIANKHFSMLTPRKWMPDAMALQYSVNGNQHADNKLGVQLALFPYSAISSQMDIPTRTGQLTLLMRQPWPAYRHVVLLLE